MDDNDTGGDQSFCEYFNSYFTVKMNNDFMSIGNFNLLNLMQKKVSSF